MAAVGFQEWQSPQERCIAQHELAHRFVLRFCLPSSLCCFSLFPPTQPREGRASLIRLAFFPTSKIQAASLEGQTGNRSRIVWLVLKQVAFFRKFVASAEKSATQTGRPNGQRNHGILVSECSADRQFYCGCYIDKTQKQKQDP